MRAVRIRNTSRKKRTFIGALFCLALASAPVMAASPGIAPNAKQVQAYEAADESTRVRLLISLARGGQHELASVMLQRYPLVGPHAANRTLFISGLIMRGRGNLTGAAELYRKALADDPTLTLVRAELAATLAELGEDDSAKHQLNRLMADAPSEEEAKGIRAFVDRIDANRPFVFNSYISIAPSTNINSGSTNNDTVYSNGQAVLPYFNGSLDGLDANGDGTIDIPKGSKAKSGVGVEVGGSVGYTKRLGNDWAAVFAAGINGRIYKDRTFNGVGASQSAELRYLIEGGSIGAGMVAGEGLETVVGDVTYYSFGPRISIQKQLTPQDRINVSAVYEWRKYSEVSAANGNALMVDGLWQHSFGSDLSMNISAGFDKVTTGNEWNAHRAYSAGLGFYKELPLGVTINLLGEYRYAHFDAPAPLYGEIRVDHQVAGSITLTKRDLNLFGYAPSLEYNYVRNFSNIQLSDFDSHTVDFTLTKDF
jgi:outer membrane protein